MNKHIDMKTVITMKRKASHIITKSLEYIIKDTHTALLPFSQHYSTHYLNFSFKISPIDFTKLAYFQSFIFNFCVGQFQHNLKII